MVRKGKKTKTKKQKTKQNKTKSQLLEIVFETVNFGSIKLIKPTKNF